MEAYRELKESGGFGQLQARVAYLIATNPDSTDRELSALYAELWHETDPNVVRPRRHELFEQGWVEESGRRICRISGRVAITWRLRINTDQHELLF
jgi:hypothetical protein